MLRLLCVSAGGIAGTLARYLISISVPAVAGSAFPYATLLINLSACFAVGLFNSLATIKGALTPEARLLLMTGFCGAYSTFSTWILETSNLATDGRVAAAGVNVLASLGLGFVLFKFGAYLGSLL